MAHPLISSLNSKRQSLSAYAEDRGLWLSRGLEAPADFAAGKKPLQKKQGASR